MPSNVDRYWNQYIESLPVDADRPSAYVDSYYFGVVPEDALEISPLVLDGRKTASGGLKWVYEDDGCRAGNGKRLRCLPRP